jgi:hypothetical protein
MKKNVKKFSKCSEFYRCRNLTADKSKQRFEKIFFGGDLLFFKADDKTREH